MANDTNTPALPEEIPQEELVILESSGAEDQLNTDPASTTESLISSPEVSAPIIEKIGMSLGLKVFLGVLGVGIVGLGIFFIAAFYESENRCRLKWNNNFDILTEIMPLICSPKGSGLCEDPSTRYMCHGNLDKPLILLYPESTQQVSVSLKYSPGFSATFPQYDNSKMGWSVTAHPDATLLDHTTGQETYGLFWEGNPNTQSYDLSKGFIIKGNEVREFLYEKLTEIGMSTKEKSDFIMFWYPKLQAYPYIQITFAGDEYEKSAPLEISPKPDSLLRVFMVAKPLDSPREIEPQKFEKFERKGFSVVEWGGTIVE